MHCLWYFSLVTPALRYYEEELVQPHLCLVSHLIKQRKLAIHFISVYVNVTN